MKKLSTLMIVLAILAFGHTNSVIADDTSNPLNNPVYLAAKSKVIGEFAANATGYASQLEPVCGEVPHYTDNTVTDRAVALQEEVEDPNKWVALDADGQEVTEAEFATPEAIATAPDSLKYKLWAIEEFKKKAATETS